MTAVRFARNLVGVSGLLYAGGLALGALVFRRAMAGS